ncbi:ABC-2 transporter permease [Schleiferilactobacillus harbinensis]|uniref:ABC-2 transporter permease n=1 Tax=Schleiferilactobacillus harbinensis TaxID=304207 RepID=UPI00123B57AA|nr:ABC-2 transporter permease [Schleiferilactobacillus harbinensis]QEU45950.1 ABC-2 transporter permease [Schleiferilactobacillus harbinensis]
MLGLIIKDIGQLRHLWLRPLVLLVGLAILAAGVFLKELAPIVGAIVIMAAIYGLTALFVDDDRTRWLDFAKMARESATAIVLSRYIVLIFLAGIIAAVASAYTVVVHLIFPNISTTELAIVTGAAIVFFLFMYFWTIPFFYQFGQKGAQYGAISFLFLFFALVRVLIPEQYLKVFFNKKHPSQTLWQSCLVLLVLIILSLIVSLTIVHRRQTQ